MMESPPCVKASQSLPASPGSTSQRRAFTLSNATVHRFNVGERPANFFDKLSRVNEIVMQQKSNKDVGSTIKQTENGRDHTESSPPNAPQLVDSPAEQNQHLSPTVLPQVNARRADTSPGAAATNLQSFRTNGGMEYPFPPKVTGRNGPENDQGQRTKEAGIVRSPADITPNKRPPYPSGSGSRKIQGDTIMPPNNLEGLKEPPPLIGHQLEQYQQLVKELEERGDPSPHVSQASHASARARSTSDRILKPGVKDINEIEQDTAIAPAPAETKFVRDGFCSCSRFNRLTKGDFILLAEVEYAIQNATDLPFQKLNEINELVKKINEYQPTQKSSFLSWIATRTRMSSWLTLGIRHRGKNREDNTYFYALLRNKTKNNLSKLIEQMQDKYPEAYGDGPLNRKEAHTRQKLDAFRENVDQLTVKKKRRSVSELDDSQGTGEAEKQPTLLFGEEDWSAKARMGVILPDDMFMSSPAGSTVSDDNFERAPDGLMTPSPAAPPGSRLVPAATRPSDLEQPHSAHAHVVAVGQGPTSSWAMTQSQPLETCSSDTEKIDNIPISKSEHKKLQKPNSRPNDPRTDSATSLINDGKRAIFIVIGWFPDELHEPIEIFARIENVEHFLPELKRHIAALRGWRSILSFKSVQGFDLYKCQTKHFTHAMRHTSKEDRVTLAHFFDATNASYFHAPDKRAQDIHRAHGNSRSAKISRWIRRKRKNRHYKAIKRRQDSEKWAEWVHKTMNLGKDCPFESQLSLKLVLNWSKRRIAIAALITLALSLGIGIYFMQTHEGVEGTSAAWTIASYIVTAGAFIIAMIAILTALKDGQTTPFPLPRRSDDSAV